MSQLRAALLVAAADLRRRLRNRSFLVQGLVGPIALAGIISLAFGGGLGLDATVGVVDADGSPMADGFVTGVTEADAGDLRFERVGSADEARARVADGDLGAAIVVPDGFTASLETATPGELLVLTSSDGAIAAEVARAVAFVFALLGGAFIPPGDLPGALQGLSLLTPTGWALRGFAELSAGGGGVADVGPHVLVLLAWGLASGLVAAWLLPRRLGGG